MSEIPPNDTRESRCSGLEVLLHDFVGPVRPLDPEVIRARAHSPRRRRPHRSFVVIGAAAVLVLALAVVPAVVGAARRTGADSQVSLTGPDTSVVRSTRWERLPDGPVDGRVGQAVVWTGSRLVVWGGEDSSGNDVAAGATYDPQRRAWRALTDLPPGNQSGHAVAVWTGRAVVACCGTGTPAGTAIAVNPMTGGWRPVPVQPDLAPVTGLGAVWTGDEMLIATGSRPAGPATQSVWRFAPDTNGRLGASGTAPADLGEPPQAFWTGTDLLIVPRLSGSASRPLSWNPSANVWRELPAPPPELTIESATAVWTGTELLLWGQAAATGVNAPARAIGASLDPATGRWRALPDAPVSVLRDHDEGTAGSSSSVWDPTRGRMVVVTGTMGSDQVAPPGAVVLAYTPATGRWERLADLPRSSYRVPLVATDDGVIAAADHYYALGGS